MAQTPEPEAILHKGAEVEVVPGGLRVAEDLVRPMVGLAVRPGEGAALAAAPMA